MVRLLGWCVDVTAPRRLVAGALWSVLVVWAAGSARPQGVGQKPRALRPPTTGSSMWLVSSEIEFLPALGSTET